jgi:hypothetical protein
MLCSNPLAFASEIAWALQEINQQAATEVVALPSSDDLFCR